MRPIVLTIAGSDPSGGAGIQADLKTVEACGGYGASAITAITVQNTRGLLRWQALDADLVRDQLCAVLEDLDVAAVKTGMLGSATIVRAVAETLEIRPGRPLVVDPVLASSAGVPLADAPTIEELVLRLFPLAALLTPNVAELRALAGRQVADLASAERAARELLDLGPAAVLVKGGHLAGPAATDLLVWPAGARAFSAPRLDSPLIHGSGCVCSTAIATGLAHGLPLERAVEAAKLFVTESIRQGVAPGGGRGALDPLHILHGTRAAPASEARKG